MAWGFRVILHLAVPIRFPREVPNFQKLFLSQNQNFGGGSTQIKSKKPTKSQRIRNQTKYQILISKSYTA